MRIRVVFVSVMELAAPPAGDRATMPGVVHGASSVDRVEASRADVPVGESSALPKCQIASGCRKQLPRTECVGSTQPGGLDAR